MSIFKRLSLEAIYDSARRLLYAGLFATVGFGWLVMVYPVMSGSTMRLWSLAIGYTLGTLGCLFLLSGRSAGSTAIPAAAGLLVVASFDLEAAIHPYLGVAGVAGILYLASDLWPRRERRLGKLVLLGGFSVSALGVGAFIIATLPWAQQKVEDTMLLIYTPASDGIQAQYRSRLGELQSLKLSKKIVMRVWSQRPQRLRSRVLVRFDGTAWSRDATALRIREPKPTPVVDEDSRAFLAELPGVDFPVEADALEDQKWIRTKIVRVDGEGLVTPGDSFLVRVPLDFVQVDSSNVVFPPIRSRVRMYGVLHAVNHQRAQIGSPSESALEMTTELPEGLDPRIQALSDELAEGATSTEDVVERIVEHLRSEYHYSLDVGAIDPVHPLSDFLFEKKEGWCEFFASSAAVLARQQGISTRYVRGFNVLGSQVKGDHYVVRDWDRHAWIEAYIEGKGWLEFDPTPAAEYESLHAGLDDGFIANAIEWARAHLGNLYGALRHFDWSTLVEPALWLVALFVVGRLTFPLVRGWRPRVRRFRASDEVEVSTALDELVQGLDRELERLGCPRPPSQAPLEHWTSLPEEKVPDELREAGRDLLHSYYRARFGAQTPSPAEIARLRESARALLR